MASQDLEAPNLFEVKGYVAVVTGGARGIGLMAAQTLAANGARVYIISRNEEALETVAVKYSSNGEIIPLPGDISTLDGISALATKLTNLEAKGINILINSASTAPETTAPTTFSLDFSDPVALSRWMTADGPEVWRSCYVANVAASHHFTAALLPLLHGACSAAPGFSSCVVNVASIAGLTKTHSQGQFALSSSMAASVHLSREWAHAFLELGVRVNCIATGLFPTRIMTAGRGREDVEEGRMRSLEEEKGKRVPAGRVGRESDIGSVVLWLCSRAGTYVNGQVIHLDGGLLLKLPSTM